jgi:hypothetical protein
VQHGQVGLDAEEAGFEVDGAELGAVPSIERREAVRVTGAGRRKRRISAGLAVSRSMVEAASVVLTRPSLP